MFSLKSVTNKRLEKVHRRDIMLTYSALLKGADSACLSAYHCLGACLAMAVIV